MLFILAALSLAVYGVVIGGWASNNKYSFLGGLRATANMISYEIPLGLAVLCIVVMYGTLDLGTIVDKQAHYWLGFIPAWNVFTQPLAFLMFLICIHAEANRAPFDLAEAEQELVGGYHTEYSSMRFALFFLAEYAGMVTTSAVCVALFFGGWHFPGGIDRQAILIARPIPAVTTSLCSSASSAAGLLHQDAGHHLRLHVGALEPAAIPLRPAHDARLAGADSDVAGAAADDGDLVVYFVPRASAARRSRSTASWPLVLLRRPT